MEFVRGATSTIVFVRALDTTSVIGGGKTGLAWNTATLTASYARSKAASAVAITLATMTLGTWATGGFVEVNAAKQPGLYALSLPDAALAVGDGSKELVIQLLGVSGAYFPPVQIDLKAVDSQDAAAFGLSRLDANSSAAPTSGDFTAAMKTSLNAATPASVTGAVGSVTADVGITQGGADKVWLSTARSLTTFGTLVADVATAVWASGTRTLTSLTALASDIAGAVWNALAASYNTVLTMGNKLNSAGSGDTATFSGAAAAQIDAIEAKTKLIGNGVLIVQAPVAVDGLTRLTAGSSYTNADGNALVYTVTGYPDFDIGAPAYWHATNKSGGATKITGIVTAIGELTFEVTAAQSRKLKTGVYALYTTSDNDNPLVMPNNTLIVDEAI